MEQNQISEIKNNDNEQIKKENHESHINIIKENKDHVDNGIIIQVDNLKINDSEFEQRPISKSHLPSSKISTLKIPFRTKKTFTKNDFEIIALAGKGAYARVLRAKYLPEPQGPLKAIKVMEIDAMEKNNKLYQIYLENEVLMDLSHPNIVNIEGIFEDKGKINIILEYLSKGDFSDFLRVNYPLKDDTIRFFAAEIVNMLEYLQEKNIVHRDLKPENIMMDNNYHLKLIDFATAKIIGKVFNKQTMKFEDENDTLVDNLNNIIESNIVEGDEFREKRGVTFVGTAEYVSPEVLKDIPSGFGADIWALGCIIYQLYCGKTPFKDKTEYLIFKKIVEHNIIFPKTVPATAQDLILKLLDRDPKKRLGAGEIDSDTDIYHLKAHPFFSDINFKDLFEAPVPHKEEFHNLLNHEIQEEKKEIIKRHLKTVATLKKGMLEKKSPWFHYNTRRIVLDSTPRLEYSDPEKNIVKGSIYLTKNCKAEHIDQSQFDLVTPNRTFKFKVRIEFFIIIYNIDRG